jgi:DNA polymerase-3 subunit beta
MKIDISNRGAESFVIVEAKALAKALKVANAIVEQRNTIPVLNTVRIGYSSHGLVLQATDLDLDATIVVDEIDGDGVWNCCIPAKYLTDIATAAGVTPLRIEPVVEEIASTPNGRKEYRAAIQAGEASYSIQAVDPSDFPEIQGKRMDRIEHFTNGRFASLLDKVSPCISTEETRYYLNGVSWSAKPQGMRLAATDGHRLAVCKYDSNEAGAEFHYIIPRKTVAVLSQFMAGADIEIFSVGVGNTVVETVLDIRAPGIEMRTKLIDGTYPDYDRVIPTKLDHKLDAQRDELLAAIRQATAVGGWRGQAIRLHGVGGRMNVEVKNPDFGTAKVTTSSAWPEGLEPFGVNSKYLAQMVKTCQGQIRFATENAGSPITVSDDDAEMTRVVMPMRV